MMRLVTRLIGALTATCLATTAVAADPVPVRFTEGVVHGFLVLSSLDGKRLATGDLIQTATADRVTVRLVFHFNDGSSHDETAVFSQRRQFRLISSRLVQKGPAFSTPIDMTIDCAKNLVTVRYTDDGEAKVETRNDTLPPDVSNGLMLTLLKNLRPQAGAQVSMVAATPKPLLVKLEVSAAGEQPFAIAGSPRKAVHYVVHPDIGGIKGLLASLLGKEPPDTHVWILTGDAPAFVKSEGPLYAGGPPWRIELAAPAWPDQGRQGTTEVDGRFPLGPFRRNGPEMRPEHADGHSRNR